MSSLIKKKNNQIALRDLNLEEIKIDYEKIRLFFSNDQENRFELKCLGFVGIKWSGVWDEFIIEKCEIHEVNDFSLECADKIKLQPPSGDPMRNLNNRCVVVITFLDGVQLMIVCNELEYFDDLIE